MKNNTRIHPISLAMAILILLLAQLACSVFTGQPSNPTATSLSGTRSASAPTQTQGKGKSSATGIAVVPTNETQPLSLLSQGFGQDKQQLGYGFIVENPNQNSRIENTSYEIALYDSGGTVVDSESGEIDLVLPGQKLGVGGLIYLSDETPITKMLIKLEDGDFSLANSDLPLTTDKVNFYPSDYTAEALGLITNPNPSILSNFMVYSIAYNSSGEIIGGGSTYMNFILANSSAGESVSIVSSGEVAKVEMYASLPSQDYQTNQNTRPDGAQDLTLVQQGFGIQDTNIGYGFLVKNPNSNYGVQDSYAHLTLYDDQGNVAQAGDCTLPALLPGQTMGIGGEFYLTSSRTMSHLDIQILAGAYVATTVTQTFTSEDVAYQADQYEAEATGKIVNPFNQDFSDLLVYAITYDSSGQIIGSGEDYLDYVPANSKVATTIYLTSAPSPAKVELYAAFQDLSDLTP